MASEPSSRRRLRSLLHSIKPFFPIKQAWTPLDVKKVAVIGVHGWFPGSFLRRVVGDPVGTSNKFASMMGTAVSQFFQERYGIVLPEESISLIPLEGEGKILERVDMLFTQLNDPFRTWMLQVQEADLVLVSAHSQGTPVSTILTSRLIEMGYLNPAKQKIGILAMVFCLILGRYMSRAIS